MNAHDDWGLASGPQQFVAQDGATLVTAPADSGTILTILFPNGTTHASAAVSGGALATQNITCFDSAGDPCPNGAIALTLDGNPGSVAVTWDANLSIPGFPPLPPSTCTITIMGSTSNIVIPPGAVTKILSPGQKAGGVGPGGAAAPASSTGTVVAVVAAAAALGGAAWWFLK